MAFRTAATTKSTNSTATFVANAPSGVTSGDVMLMVCTGDSSTLSYTSTGWTVVTTIQIASPDGQGTTILTKIAGLEPATYNITPSDSTRPIVVIIGCWSGRNTVAAFVRTDTSNTSGNSTPISINASGVTALVGDDIAWIATLDMTALDNWSFTPPTGYTEAGDDFTDFTAATMAYKDNVSAGATGTIIGTATRNSGTLTAGWMASVISIAAASAALTITGLTSVTGLSTIT